MKPNIFVYILLIGFCISCTQHFGMKDPMLRHLPKEVPEMVMRTYGNNDIRTEDTIYGQSYHCILSFFLVSKNEITNRQFCYFLNEDSIRTNTALLNSIIDLSHADNKIHLLENKYVPLKGYEDYPVVRVSWWGARKYGVWLTAYVNKKWKGPKRHAVPYRLPTEFEWLIASSSNGSYTYTNELICDTMNMLVHNMADPSHTIKVDALNAGGIAGMNENVFEWTEDNFYLVKYSDYPKTFTYPYEDGITADAVVRKHGYINKNSCGRLSRSRTGFYSDTGFRVVQTYIGKSSGVEF